MKILKIIPDTVVDGPGLRTSIYFAGCLHHCKGCHNQESWNFEQGKYYSAEELVDEISKYNPNKITLTGGDPLQHSDIGEILKFIYLMKEKYDSNIWVYTGYTFEELTNFVNILDYDYRISCLESILANIDVLVDGPFIQTLKDVTLSFRGSSNQRIIDVQKSFANSQIVLYTK